MGAAHHPAARGGGGVGRARPQPWRPHPRRRRRPGRAGNRRGGTTVMTRSANTRLAAAAPHRALRPPIAHELVQATPNHEEPTMHHAHRSTRTRRSGSARALRMAAGLLVAGGSLCLFLGTAASAATVNGVATIWDPGNNVALAS